MLLARLKMAQLQQCIALISLALSAVSATAEPAVQVLGQHLAPNHLLVAVETLVYTRSWGGHGTGAEKDTGYILRIDLNSEKQELFGPLFTEKDDLHWQKVAGESGMSVRSVGAQGQLLQPASCTGHGQLLNSPDTLGLVAGDLSCRDRRIDPWIKIVKERAPWVLGPNSGLIDSETSDGRYYVPRFEASYYRGNPAQAASPQGGELRQYYKTFTVAGKSYDRSQTGYYYRRPEFEPQVYIKPCIGTLGHDRAKPISVEGVLRLVCLKDKRIALYDLKGKALVAQDLEMKSLRGMMHSVARSSLYFLRDSHSNSLHSLQLLRWNYVDNSVKVSHIALETRFKKGLFSSAYGVPPNARPISGR